MELFSGIISELEGRLRQDAEEREADGLPQRKGAEVRVLGQMSLLLNPDFSTRLPLVATVDLDAIIIGDSIVRSLLKEALNKRSIRFDDQSSEVWVPEGARFISYYESPLIKVSYLDPLSALVSKAVKAKEKNRFLIKAAIEVLGDELRDAVIRHGGDLDYFLNE